MPDNDLLKKVTRARAEQARDEIADVYPQATVRYETAGGRGVVTVLDDRFVVSKEFVETDDSLRENRMGEYARVLMGRSRLVLVVPRDRAAKVRLKLLDLNRHWLFYYQLHCYDEDGKIIHVDRRTWRKLMGLPPERQERAPEIV
ncbi:hypothetical protein [Methanomassiliicoccus luminyensis]|uniref:hypothetical protein n=1 Tax=Methanomassiliicoccus luminyensis TaxID=1080712 RepID=UPI000371773F|nr:hypothetical protein [Methanomassiliicoccus luminyensis]